jgi:3'(2'), 5'-bisphosphate nucleotidase
MKADPASLLEPVTEIARAAGRAILAIYGSDFEVETKADHSPLTAADRASHQLIVDELQRLTPGLPVWSEESATVPFARRAAWTDFWLVDPLDGTKEFIKRNGEFTVNIALISNHEPVLGVVHVPVSGNDYYACRGRGAFFCRNGGSPEPIHVRSSAAEPVRVVGSRSHRGNSLEAFLERVGPHEMIGMGSSLKLCLVASGEADVYPRLGPTSEWDTAAAQAVVECAGGRVVNLEGQPIRYNTHAEVLNPYFLVYGDTTRDWLACATGQ